MASAPVTSAAEIRRATWLYDWAGGGGPMQTDSSARRTCRLSRSAWLNTATVEISSSRQARITRRAISPRLAIRTFRNMPPSRYPFRGNRRPRRRADLRRRCGRPRRVRAQLAGALGLDGPPGAVRGGDDALQLQQQLVRLVGVLERFL